MLGRRAVGKLVAAVILVIIIIVAGSIAYYVTLPSTTVPSTGVSSTGVPSTGAYYNKTFTIDIANWPLGSLNQLNAFTVGIYPDLPGYTSWQPLVAVNLTAMYPAGGLPGTFQFLPDLATSWTVSPDGTTYTFHLRPNVTYSNGDPFNAYQVWTVYYGFYYLSGNATGWYNGYLLFNMAPVEFGPESISLLQQSGLINPSAQALAMMTNSSWPIYVVDQNTIAFHVRHPFPWFLGTFAAELGCIYDAQYVLQHGAFGTPVSLNTYFNLNAIPGTGPYMVTSVAASQFVEFTQNPTYWGKDLPESTIVSNPAIDPGHAKNVLVKIVPDATARYIELSSGAAQMVDPMGASNFAVVVANPDKYGYITLAQGNGAISMESLNTKKYPTNITDVRLAIVHAINMTNVITKAYGHGASAYQIVGPEYPMWSDFYDLGNFQPYSYNLTLASQYLAEAGFPNGTGLPTLTWRLQSTCAVCVNRATVAQAQLKKIGINVVINGVTPDDWCAWICQPYSWLVNNANLGGNIEDPEGSNAQPAFLTPAEYWVAFTTNQSAFSNTAIYNTPITYSCAESFFSGISTATLQSICTQAQAQVYNDAPYFGWVSVKYQFGDSSPVWDRSVVENAYIDPLWAGVSTVPLFNTVTFTSS